MPIQIRLYSHGAEKYVYLKDNFGGGEQNHIFPAGHPDQWDATVQNYPTEKDFGDVTIRVARVENGQKKEPFKSPPKHDGDIENNEAIEITDDDLPELAPAGAVAEK
jgi:hypothetical protein